MKLSENKAFMAEFDTLIEKYTQPFDYLSAKVVPKDFADLGTNESHSNRDLDNTDGTNTIKPFKIEEGEWYYCIEDVYDNNNTHLFSKNIWYYSPKDDYLRANTGVIEIADTTHFQHERKDEAPQEPKFKVGDFIVKNTTGECDLITKITDEEYILKNTGFIPRKYENTWHHWTLQDAKDGDILISDSHNLLWIYHTDKTAYAYLNLNHQNATLSYNSEIVIPEDVHPTTNNERKLLFQQLEIQGYEWVNDKKELKKIGTKWRDDEDQVLHGYYLTSDGLICNLDDLGDEDIQKNTKDNYSTFATEAQAKSALAMARISQIMANDTRFGGTVTDEEWKDQSWQKYTFLVSFTNKIECYETTTWKDFLSFHTAEQRNLFMRENMDLIEDYLMITREDESGSTNN